MLLWLFIGTLAFSYVESLCNLPCVWQIKGSYAGPRERYQFSCKDSSRYLAIKGNIKEKRECYDSEGPFMVVRRPGNNYQCMKMVKGLEKDVTFYYETPFTYFKYNPTLCEVCGVGKFEPEPLLFASETRIEVNYKKEEIL